MGRSPDRRYRREKSDDEEDRRRSSHKESRRYRNRSDEERSDDEYEKQKKQRKKQEKELKKKKEKESRGHRAEEYDRDSRRGGYEDREREGRRGGHEEYDREGRRSGYGDEYGRGGEHSGRGQVEYVSSHAPPQPQGQYQPYGPGPASGYRGEHERSGHHQPYGNGDYQRGPEPGYEQPPPSQYAPYNSPSPYGQPPRSPSYAHVSPPTAHGFQGQYQPPPPQGGYQNQYPPPPGPPPPLQGAYQAQYPPPSGPPPPHQPQGAYQGYPPQPPQGVYQAQYPPLSGPPPPAQVYHGQYPPPPPAPALGGSMGAPPAPAPAGGVAGIAAGLAAGLSFNSRPQYATGGTVTAGYKPQAHSTAQEAGEGTGNTFFSGRLSTPSTPNQGGSVLDTFSKGLNNALHGYARTLFPATSSFSNTGQVNFAPEAHTGERFESFAPVRNGNAAKWYVDGKDYMFAVSVALERARESIWILDWWLSPELYLRRPPKYNEQYRLDRMLQAAAARGVLINVVVYKEVTQALTLDSHHTKHALEDLHPNICVFRHPDHLPDRDNVIRDTWSKIKSGNYKLGDGLKGIYGFKDDITLYFAHHEKLCLIDGTIAFMGGLDLCFGRFDTNEHPIADAHPSDISTVIYPGQDYNNGRFLDFQHVNKWEENVVSRLEHSRMGWTDVAMSLVGPGVEDLKTHFIQRWNFIYDSKYDARGVVKYKRLDDSAIRGGHGYHRRHLKEKLKENLYEDGDYPEGDYYGRPPPRREEPEGVRIQICRSISKWSHGTIETEHSVANAYIEIIQAARHFVYMENQFFITATDPNQKPILNMIGRAIVDRIIRAHHDAERFRIVVVIPAIPGFAGDLQGDDALGTRAIMEFQYRSINRDRGYSIYEQLKKAGVDPKEYIRFYNLRSYDRINTAGAKIGGEQTGVNYEAAARAHDEAVGGGVGYGAQGGQAGQYGAPVRGDEYTRYQKNAPNLRSKGEWDSVAKCVMLGGGDIRQVPWDGNPDEEINAFVSEELYVHSKLLIADDRIVLMGSANLNDRSQLGDHDSEIACVIEDPTPLPSHMNGRRYTAAHFAATLRRQIFRKHLGLIPAQNFHTVDENMQPVPVPNIYDFDSPEDRLVEDPLSDEFWGFWNQTAKINTDVFAKVFHSVPHDLVTNWKLYDEYWGKHFATPKPAKKEAGVEPEKPKPAEPWGHVVRSEFSPGAQGAREVKEILSAVRGMLVEMPLDFLSEEDIAQEGLGLNALTETLYT